MKHACVIAVVVIGCSGAPAALEPPPTEGITMLEQVPPDALELHVNVHRWSCSVTDPQGVVDSELHVPTGRAVRLVIANTDTVDELDVAVGTRRVHVPRGAIPYIGFRIDHVGSYVWQCPVQTPPNTTASAKLPIFVQLPDSYIAYQAMRTDRIPKTRDDKIALGRKLYERKACVACHTLDGTPRIGPSWKGIWGKNATLSDGSVRMVDETYVRESILTPSAFARPGYPSSMPSFEAQLEPHELDALIALISSLAD